MIMTKLITYCDHCSKVLNDMEDYCSTEIEIGYTEFEVDLCKECYEALVRTTKDFCSCGGRNF